VAAIHNDHTAFSLPVTTIALVQGDALGGGFECALAHDVIVVERSAKFGLPRCCSTSFPVWAPTASSRGGAADHARRNPDAAELHGLGIVDVWPTTVRNHVNNLYRRTDTHGRAALVVWARECGFAGEEVSGPKRRRRK
jgi:enoyl-CoA hydratase/carnithine racemase